jgi:hypothetical protein
MVQPNGLKDINGAFNRFQVTSHGDPESGSQSCLQHRHAPDANRANIVSQPKVFGCSGDISRYCPV